MLILSLFFPTGKAFAQLYLPLQNRVFFPAFSFNHLHFFCHIFQLYPLPHSYSILLIRQRQASLNHCRQGLHDKSVVHGAWSTIRGMLWMVNSGDAIISALNLL